MSLSGALRIVFSAALLLVFWASSSLAQDSSVGSVVDKFGTAKGFSQIGKVIDELGELGDPLAAPALRALSEGNLKIDQSDKSVVIVSGEDLLDPVTGKKISDASGKSLKKIKIKNSLRRAISAALSGMTLRAKDAAVRKQAAQTIFESSDAAQLEALEGAMAAEQDQKILALMKEARASIVLNKTDDPAAMIDAISIIQARGDRAALSLLSAFEASAEGEPKQEAAKAISRINDNLALWEVGQNVWYGLSLGSVLFLAAIGLAITFGVMGVINMAHGEMVMLGAYTTFVVQEIFRQNAPGLFDYSLLLALPLAFLVTALVGLCMERGIIRYLYGRPLETLLATWGVSLVLQQTVRTIFGPTNREVGNPSW
ncbi:MAG: ABC transporter permease subunit, partial [Rhizobiaceae bacterium]